MPARFAIPQTEMYCEPFHVPEPDAVVFEERWASGEWFRSGMVWDLGRGHVFYFRPGHETHPVFKQAENLRVVENAARYLVAQLPTATATPPPAKAKAAAPSSRLGMPHTENFTVAERPAFLYLPPPEKRSSPQPWIFYSPTLPPYPDQAERWMHEQFTAADVAHLREAHPGVVVLAHPECSPEVIAAADYTGSTAGMMALSMLAIGIFSASFAASSVCPAST